MGEEGDRPFTKSMAKLELCTAFEGVWRHQGKTPCCGLSLGKKSSTLQAGELELQWMYWGTEPCSFILKPFTLMTELNKTIYCTGWAKLSYNAAKLRVCVRLHAFLISGQDWE